MHTCSPSRAAAVTTLVLAAVPPRANAAPRSKNVGGFGPDQRRVARISRSAGRDRQNVPTSLCARVLARGSRVPVVEERIRRIDHNQHRARRTPEQRAGGTTHDARDQAFAPAPAHHDEVRL